MGDALDSWLRGIEERNAIRASASAAASSRNLVGSVLGYAAVGAFLAKELRKYAPEHPYFRGDDSTFDEVFGQGARAASADAAMQRGRDCSDAFPSSARLQQVQQLDATLARSAQQSAELERVRGELNIANGEIDKANVQLVGADQRIKSLEAALTRATAEAEQYRRLNQQSMEDAAGNLALRIVMAQALKDGNPDLPILKDMALRERITKTAATVLRSAQTAIAAGELPPEITNPFEAVRAYAVDLWKDELRRLHRSGSADILKFPLDARIGTGGGEAGS